MNPRCACAARVTVVESVCVCRDLTSGVSVHPENDIMYPTGNKGQNNCVNFSETASLQG